MKQFVELFVNTFVLMIQGILESLPSSYELINNINKVKTIFGWQGILQYGFGVPEIIFTILSVISIVIAIVKWLLKHKVI